MTVNWDHVYDSVGPGWRKLLEDYRTAVTWLESVQPGFKLSSLDIKEKFGTLRMHPSYEVTDVPSATAHIVDALEAYAENRSCQTCETCGAWGTLRRGGWMVTLCNTCDAARPKRDTQEDAPDAD